MVKVDIEVDGEKKSLYMDNKLYRQIKEKVKPKIYKKDRDWVWIVDGAEGSGKSVFAMQIGKVLDPNLSLDQVCMTPRDFTKAIIKAKKGQCIIFDEAFTGLSSRASLTEINKLLVSLMMEMRQKNLFVIIVMPTFFMLDRYVALFRARGLFHIYLTGGNRGRWIYFNNKKKKLLYLLGKKLFSYNKPKSQFRGRFLDNYTINEEGYRLKKEDSLVNKSRSTKAETYKGQRDILFWILYNKYKLNYSILAKLCKEYGYSVDRTTIYDVIMQKKKDLLQDEVEEELKADETAKKVPNKGDIPLNHSAGVGI